MRRGNTHCCKKVAVSWASFSGDVMCHPRLVYCHIFYALPLVSVQLAAARRTRAEGRSSIGVLGSAGTRGGHEFAPPIAGPERSRAWLWQETGQKAGVGWGIIFFFF